MHRAIRAVPLALLAGGLTACGKDSSGPGAGFECLGQALPTTAPPTITVAGQTKGNALSPTALGGVEIIASRTGHDTLAAATSNTPGMFSLTITTGGTPVDGYLQLTKSTYLPTYAYPSRPLAGDVTENVLMITGTEFSFLSSAVGVPQTTGNGFIGVVVKNCAGTPLAGATVTASPPGTVRYNSGSTPSPSAMSTSADGVAYVFNVAAGNVTLYGTASGHALRQHVVNARANTITLTEIQP